MKVKVTVLSVTTLTPNVRKYLAELCYTAKPTLLAMCFYMTILKVASKLSFINPTGGFLNNISSADLHTKLYED